VPVPARIRWISAHRQGRPYGRAEPHPDSRNGQTAQRQALVNALSGFIPIAGGKECHVSGIDVFDGFLLTGVGLIQNDQGVPRLALSNQQFRQRKTRRQVMRIGVERFGQQVALACGFVPCGENARLLERQRGREALHTLERGEIGCGCAKISLIDLESGSLQQRGAVFGILFSAFRSAPPRGIRR
jgi:hypothetical protein